MARCDGMVWAYNKYVAKTMHGRDRELICDSFSGMNVTLTYGTGILGVVHVTLEDPMLLLRVSRSLDRRLNFVDPDL